MTAKTVKAKKIEIFCGTGGVGKTTVATSRALHLTRSGKSVLLMTIDPSLRLKQLFSLEQEDAGLPKPINHSHMTHDKGQLAVLLMDNEKTLEYALGQKGFNNHILHSLSRPYSGMNEILALIELDRHLNNDDYDHIVLDTPPGKHFLDFIDAAEKINHFFDKSFIRIFTSLRQGKDKSILSTLLGASIKKVLGYLEKVTGENFVEAFIDALLTLFSRKDYFLKGLAVQQQLDDAELGGWFLVSSVDQQKSEELKSFYRDLTTTTQSNKYLIVNRSLKKHLHDWSPSEAALIKLKDSMLNRENDIKMTQDSDHNRAELTFPDVLSTDPKDHIEELCNYWETYSSL